MATLRALGRFSSILNIFIKFHLDELIDELVHSGGDVSPELIKALLEAKKLECVSDKAAAQAVADDRKQWRRGRQRPRNDGGDSGSEYDDEDGDDSADNAARLGLDTEGWNFALTPIVSNRRCRSRRRFLVFPRLPRTRFLFYN